VPTVIESQAEVELTAEYALRGWKSSYMLSKLEVPMWARKGLKIYLALDHPPGGNLFHTLGLEGGKCYGTGTPWGSMSYVFVVVVFRWLSREESVWHQYTLGANVCACVVERTSCNWLAHLGPSH
jgi:hypothetical protein